MDPNSQDVLNRLFSRSSTPALNWSQSANTVQPDRPSTAIQQSQARAPSCIPEQPILERGFAIVPYVAERVPGRPTKARFDGDPVKITDPQTLGVVQQGIRDGSLARRSPALPAFSITTHVPLSDKDEPFSPYSGQHKKFRLLVEWVNEVQRRRPDLELAKQRGWTRHIDKIGRNIAALEHQIQTRLRKLGDSATFRQLLPTYPQLWQYLDPSECRALQTVQSAPMPSRLLGAPAMVEEEDDKGGLLSSEGRGQHRAGSQGSIARWARGSSYFKSEDEDTPVRSHRLSIDSLRRPDGKRTVATRGNVKSEVGNGGFSYGRGADRYRNLPRVPRFTPPVRKRSQSPSPVSRKNYHDRSPMDTQHSLSQNNSASHRTHTGSASDPILLDDD
ncbi:hypothetical protein BJ170DRAFT_599891 [Xylariales sp. AK1849]|nr:hypothetical protein BJ170DRAFT_599891 [Xylariales sp. AK1849]